MYEGHLPWFAKVFVLYLAFVLALSAARAIGLIQRLRALRKLEQEIAIELTSKFPLSWELLYAKTAAIKGLSMLTLLLSLLVFAWRTAQIILGITMEKSTGVAFLAGSMAEVLTVFSLGILVCTVLYTFAIVFDAVLVRRKMRFNFTKSE
jgi:hypothetical protein